MVCELSRVRLLGLPIEVRSELRGEAADNLQHFLGTFEVLPDDVPAELTYRLHPTERDVWTLTGNDALLLQSGRPEDLPPALELAAYREALAVLPDLAVHGAALVVNGCTLLLAGASGSGKSTLAASLVGAGADYLTDECVAWRPDGSIYGLHRPICLDRLGHVVTHLGGLAYYPYRLWKPNGACFERYLVVPPKSQRIFERPRVDAVILPTFAPDAAPGWDILTPAAALLNAWGASLSVGRGAFERLHDRMHDVPTYRLSTSTVREAQRHILEIVRDIRQRPVKHMA